MLVSYVPASKPAKKNQVKDNFRKPFILSGDEGSEAFIFITAIKESAPFEYTQVGPIDFSKYVVSPEASFSENAGKHFQPRYMTKILTEKQAKEVEVEAKKRTIQIPPIANLKYDHKHPQNGPEYFPSKLVCVGDFIILNKVEPHSELDEDLVKKVQEKEVDDTLEQSTQKGIYKAQEKKKKK